MMVTCMAHKLQGDHQEGGDAQAARCAVAST